MKILFVIRSLAHFSYIASIAKALDDDGVEVDLLFDPYWSRKASPTIVEEFIKQSRNVRMDWAIQRDDYWRHLVFPLRELRSYISYLRRPDQSAYYTTRWAGYLVFPLRQIVKFKIVEWLLTILPVSTLLNLIEKAVPAHKKIKNDLVNRNPRAVVVTPMYMRFSEEVEYAKAAKAMGIHVAVPVYSWDNLTTKGLYHVTPDLTLAWNEVQKQEAEQIHAIPSNRIVITGSPFFDKWFDAGRRLENHREFCRRINLPSDRPFILYLGSSANIASDETWLVEELYRCLNNHPNSAIRELSLLVRPHPANAKIYEKLKDENITVWPKDGALPEADQTQIDFFNMLHHSQLTIGVNTSGMIDAIINNKPTISVLTKKYHTTQQQTVHFRQLLKADVLEVAKSPDEALAIVEKILAGRDCCRDQRLRFRENFVRPCGLEFEAGAVAAEAIITAAQDRRH